MLDRGQRRSLSLAIVGGAGDSVDRFAGSGRGGLSDWMDETFGFTAPAWQILQGRRYLLRGGHDLDSDAEIQQH